MFQPVRRFTARNNTYNECPLYYNDRHGRGHTAFHQNLERICRERWVLQGTWGSVVACLLMNNLRGRSGCQGNHYPFWNRSPDALTLPRSGDRSKKYEWVDLQRIKYLLIFFLFWSSTNAIFTEMCWPEVMPQNVWSLCSLCTGMA